jgi:phosphatidylglycerophosphate synthase
VSTAASPEPGSARRPLSSRDTAWAAALSRALVRWRIRPNAISLFSVAATAGSGAALVAAPRCPSAAGAAALYIAAAAGIQLRLLCNLMDGMVAVEGGMGGPLGELYNDLPDRFADAFVLVGAGYALRDWPHGVELGWLVAALAVLTAYVRVLGAAAGAKHYFLGPMAKPHRMAAMTAACLLAAGERLIGWPQRILPAALALIAVGCLVTMGRRLVRIAADLRVLKSGAATGTRG